MSTEPVSIPENPVRRLHTFLKWFADHQPNSDTIQDVLIGYFEEVEGIASPQTPASLYTATKLPFDAVAAVKRAVDDDGKAIRLCSWKSSADKFFLGFALESPVHSVTARLNGHHMEILDACAEIVEQSSKPMRDEAAELLLKVRNLRQDVGDMKIDDSLRTFVVRMLDQIERAIVDHCSGIPNQDRVVMATVYDTWREEKKTKQDSTGAKALGRLREVIVGASNFVVRANAALGLSEKVQQLLEK